jgi:hypothetical protein
MCIVLETLARRYKICRSAADMTPVIEERVFAIARKKQNLPEPEYTARIEYQAFLELGRQRLPSYIEAEYDHGV